MENLNQLLPYAEEQGVVLLIKTSGIYADTTRLRKVLDQYASDHLAALWDVHHTYRDFRETGDTTIKNLGSYVCHVHLRDSDDNCAYHGIPRGTERERQNWTNYDLKILVKELKKHGVGFYAGIMGSYTHNLHHHEFLSDHPELRSFKLDEDRSLCCLKRFKDGSYYEDFFAKNTF